MKICIKKYKCGRCRTTIFNVGLPYEEWEVIIERWLKGHHRFGSNEPDHPYPLVGEEDEAL